MMFTKGSGSALVYVTSVNGGQSFTFGTGDPMNLNQFVTDSGRTRTPPRDDGTHDKQLVQRVPDSG